ncbi:MAG: penicillin-binding transpeptidase domain-containing protein [Firmicutes bacterium]|nr:penicillin-binding transpeptidase domain-containing protein [Bacillota bacterium]
MMKRRTFLALLFTGLFDMTIIGRLVSIQGVHGKKLRQLADDVHFRGVPLPAFRGDIVDRHGVVLASSHHVYSLYAVPGQTARYRDQEAILLGALLHKQPAVILRRLKQRLGFVWLQRKMTPEQVDAVRAQLASLPGIHFINETTRYYPQGPLLGPVLGFTGIDNQGLDGLELYYNKALVGKPGRIQEEYDAVGKTVKFSRDRIVPSAQGNTLELSIDEKIQWMAEQAAEQAAEETQAKGVTIIVMDPATGGILAFAQRPSFNPNHYKEYNPQRYRLHGVTDAVPPGSIFKPVTLAAALEERATSVHSGFFCPGYKVVAGRRVNCWRLQGHGAETLADVVKNSCNVGFMDIGLALGKEKFYEYVHKFGLDNHTPLDFPGLGKGIFPKPSRVTVLDLAIMAFGQTLTVTPIDMLNAIVAIANGGTLLTPHFAQRIMDPHGQVIKDFARRPIRTVVSERVANLVQSMMVQVVGQGTGKLGGVNGYHVAGKTGTAQKVVDGRVQKGVYISSFVGFAPVPDPRFAILVNVDEPVGAYYGGQVAAPIFSRLSQKILEYLNVPPDPSLMKPSQQAMALVPNLVNLSPEQAMQDAELFGFPVQFEGSGSVVVDQSIAYGGWYPPGTVVAVKLGSTPRIYMDWVAVPQMVSLSPAHAMQLGEKLGINVQVIGPRQGTILRQSVPAGHEVRSGSRVRVWTWSSRRGAIRQKGQQEE